VAELAAGALDVLIGFWNLSLRPFGRRCFYVWRLRRA
jgi:hypothetical protein